MDRLARFSFAYLSFLVAAALSSVAAWVTHVVTCIHSASWLLLIAGAIMPPIGAIHGYGVWFGVVVVIIEAIILAAGLIAAAAIISNTIESIVVDLAEDFFTRWDALMYDEDED